MKRRTFLATAGVGLGGVLALAAGRRLARPRPVVPTAPAAARRTLSEAEWRTLAAAQDRLLPSAPGSPGARDVNAVGYLDAALAEAETDPADRERVRRGAARLDALAVGRGARSFADLDEAKGDEALRAFAAEDDGDDWMEVVLGFTLEAFLGDPAHGGNPEEVAWRWLDHQPGWPRPPLPGRT